MTNRAKSPSCTNSPKDAHGLNIWIIHDSRPGHITQLEGLAQRLQSHTPAETIWLSAEQVTQNWKNIALRRLNGNMQHKPDLIIGAGHKTHKGVLLAAKRFHAFSTLIMKPSLPTRWFNAIIAPKHDGLRESKRVLNTLGTINKITPPSISCSRPLHTMLIGGPSKHFSFNEEALLKQIQTVCTDDNTVNWNLSDSPRTPPTLLEKLKALKLRNLSLHHYKDGTLPPLENVLQQSMACWVTPDSMSMLYESLTAKCATYIFDIPNTKPNKPSKIGKNINQLISEQWVVNFNTWQSQPSYQSKNTPHHDDKTLWEADRAAIWLLEKLRRHTYTR